MKLKLATALLLLTTASISFAQHNFSIPVDNWAYDAIQQLQTRGYLLDLSPGFKPYRRTEVAEALQKLEKSADISKLPQPDQWLIGKLKKEFSYEMNLLNAKQENPDTSFTDMRFSEEAFLNLAKGDYKTFKYADKVEFRPTLRSEFGFDIGNHFLLYTDATVDQTLNDDTLYTGSKKFGLRALHQQAYLQYSDKYIDFTFGRDYLSWGYGNNGTTLISTTPGAFDMASLFIKTGVLKFNWFVAQLNPDSLFTRDTTDYTRLWPTGPTPNTSQPPIANRYFTGSRVEFNIADKVFLGVYQAATFGGQNVPIDLELINPVRTTYETEANSNKDPNTFIGADVSVFWPRDLNFYGDLMIDDWQVDHKVITDLKPDVYAFDLGVKASNILSRFGVSGTDANLQFSMVRNRVYNEYNWISFEKLLLRNYPVASPYGDDFWDIDLRLSHWLTCDWKVAIELMHLEHGSQNIYGPFTMPWLTDPNITLQTGYSEAFPYGIIQETNLFQASALYQPRQDLYGQVMISYSQNRNYQYSPGVNKGVFSFMFTIYYNFTTTVPFQ